MPAIGARQGCHGPETALACKPEIRAPPIPAKLFGQLLTTVLIAGERVRRSRTYRVDRPVWPEGTRRAGFTLGLGGQDGPQGRPERP
jgi:hypothetical protein